MSVKTYTELQSCLKRVFSCISSDSFNLIKPLNPQLKVNENLMSYHRSIDGDFLFSICSFLYSGPVSVCVLLYGIILI